MSEVKERIGLDVDNGKYRVTGIVTSKKIFKRRANKKGIRTNIAPHPIGYRLEDIETGNVKLVEKSEGVIAVGKYGAVNSYVMIKDNSIKDEDGEVIQEKINSYLQPYPAHKEAFTQDDRIVNIFKYDENGNIDLDPLELMVTEEQCTDRLWNIILSEKERYEERRSKRAKPIGSTEDVKARQLRESFKRMIEDTEIDFKM